MSCKISCPDMLPLSAVATCRRRWPIIVVPNMSMPGAVGSPPDYLGTTGVQAKGVWTGGQYFPSLLAQTKNPGVSGGYPPIIPPNHSKPVGQKVWFSPLFLVYFCWSMGNLIFFWPRA